jgi:hypothetical protein
MEDYYSGRIQPPDSMAEARASVKRLGYAARERIGLYGEEFEVVSDPFPYAGGIAVNVRTTKDAQVRIVRLPATVLQSVMGREQKIA